MKAQLELQIKPLQVPNMVQVDLSKAPKIGDYSDLEAMYIPLYQLDSITIDKLCKEFRDTMFRMADKEQPPRSV